MPKSLEDILGQIAHDRPVPWLQPQAAERTIYVSFDAGADPARQFDDVTGKIDPPVASEGGVILLNWVVRLPDETTMLVLKFRGDLQGWRDQIEMGAAQLGSLTATLAGNALSLSDGRTILVSDCAAEQRQLV